MYKYQLKSLPLIPLSVYPEVELLGRTVILHLIFLVNQHTFFHSGCTREQRLREITDFCNDVFPDNDTR